jgi:adenylate kinase
MVAAVRLRHAVVAGWATGLGFWRRTRNEETGVNIIMIGAQGSGKGTQAEMLEQKVGLKPCASGELLREHIARETPLGLAAKPYVDRGDLVPDELVVQMILDFIRSRGSAGIVLDGFPRTIPQAERLDDDLAQMDQRIDRVIYLEAPRDVLLARLSGRYICRAHGHVWNIYTKPPRVPGICDSDGSELYQRSDDTPGKIAHRLDIFFNETIKLLDYYGAQDKLTRVDGTQPIDVVTRAVLAALRVEA